MTEYVEKKMVDSIIASYSVGFFSHSNERSFIYFVRKVDLGRSKS